MIKSALFRRSAAALAAALGLGAAAAAPAAATQCQIGYFAPGGSGGVLVALVGPNEGGSWRLHGAQQTPGNGQDVDLRGQFAPSSRWTELARSHVSTAYVSRGHRGYPELRDGEFGVDSAIDLRLTVFDRRGRIICRDRYRNEPRVSVRDQARDFHHGPGGRPF